MSDQKDINHKIFNVLIVDDVPANLKVLGEILKGEGYKVRPVTSGTLALQVVEKEKPDLILLDIMMPNMNGYEVCNKLKENPLLNDIPVIFISALNDINDIVKAFTSGGVDYITKPFQAEEVIARVSTHLKISQQKQELHRLNMDKDSFISILAHDLKSPFNALLGITELLAENIRTYDINKIEHLINTLNNSVQTTYSLLEDILMWAKSQSGKFPFEPQEINFKEVCIETNNILKYSANAKNITINLLIDDIYLSADINMLKTVMRNLITNAIKFTRSGGKIEIQTKKTNTEVIVSVSDNGIGISPQMLTKLFDFTQMYTTTGTANESGTGFGLLLCKDFIEKHGGKISVVSNLGEGSTFSFTIPTSDNSMENSYNDAAEISESQKPNRNLKVLITDDDETSRIYFSELISAFSSDILLANTGMDAVMICKNNPNIDVVILDIKMPGMNGYETAQEIRQFNKKIVIIAQSAHVFTEDKAKAINAGCNDFITKPVNKLELAAMLKKHTCGII